MADVAGADVRLQMDLGSAPFILNRDHLNTDVLTPPDDAYDDVTCDVSRGSWTWGATQPLGPLTTVAGGRARFDLLDPTRLFDPANDASDYAAILHIGTPLRVTADGEPVWSGALESWSYDVGSFTSTLNATDALAALAARPIPTGTAIPAGSFLAQAGKVLDAAGWPAERRAFSGTPASYRSAVTVDGSAATVLETVRLAELGEIWADHAGNIAARGRGDPYEPPPVAQINCGGALLASLQSVFSADRVRNYIEVDAHAPPSYTDAASVLRHGRRPFRSAVADLALVDAPVGFLAIEPEPFATPRTPPASQTAIASSALAKIGGSNLGGGADQHLPVGYWGGDNFRSVLKFNAIDWTGVAAVVSATLRLKTTTQVHVGFGSSPRVRAQRLTGSWSPNSATNDGGGLWSSSPVAYPGPGHTSTGESVVSPSGAENATVNIDITAIVRAWAPAAAGGSGAGQYGIGLYPGTENDGTDTIEFWSAKASTANRPTLLITVTTNRAPNAPSLVSPVGPGASVAGGFVATVSDPDGDAIVAYGIELRNAAATVIWSVPAGTAGIVGGTVTVPYTGPALTAGASYSWHMRAQDGPGAWGPYSDWVTFSSGTAPPEVYARWASTILAALAEPTPLTILGTVRPQGPEVAAIVGAEYGDRFLVVDEHTTPTISRTLRVLGMSVDLAAGPVLPDGTSGPGTITATAVTEDD